MHDPGNIGDLWKTKLSNNNSSRFAYSVNVVNQFFSAPRVSQWDSDIRILRYVKSAPGKTLLYSDYRHSRMLGSHMQIGQRN